MTQLPDGTLTWDQPTVRLKQGEMTLVQSLGDPAARSACLVLYSGAEPGQRFALPEGTLSMGRAPDCQVLLDNPAISRRHAELQVQGAEVRLRDLGSVNGSWVNEQRLRENTVLLADGDMLRLGEVVLKFFQRESIDALLHDRIYRMATVDAGTEVFTRRYVMDTLAREIRRARRGGGTLSVLGIDLDHFKSVNDRWGHNAGDQVLREAAATAHATLRSTDVLGRTGGEEFLAVLPDTGLTEARALAERVRAAIAARPVVLTQPDGREVQHAQTASIGVATLTPALLTLRDLLGAADARLYEAKHAGRNRVAG
jgi:diguanylate cyclase (GGDEF)-like protein